MSDEMKAFAARLKAEVQKNGGPKAVAEASGVPLSTLNTYLSGSAEPKIMAVVKLARALGKSVSELTSLESETTGNETRAAISIQDVDSVAIPMLDAVASAGPGYENERTGELRVLPFPRSLLRALGVRERDARFLQGRGDSMLPTIKDGAVMLVDISFSRVKDDGIYVLIVGNDWRIKRVAKGWEGALQLLSDNERYKPEQLAPPEAEALRVAGKVIWAGGEL